MHEEEGETGERNPCAALLGRPFADACKWCPTVHTLKERADRLTHRSVNESLYNYEVPHGFGHGVRAIARPQLSLRLFEVAADRFFAEAECLCRFL